MYIECILSIMEAEFAWSNTREGKRYAAAARRRMMIHKLVRSPEGQRVLAEHARRATER